MKRALTGPVIFLHTCLASACTIFLASDEGLVLAGNNEDYYLDAAPQMWVSPGGYGEHGRITFGFFDETKTKPFAQGGVNDAGLFFDGAVTPEVGKPQRGKTDPPENMGDAMLAQCATVDEAVAWLEARDLFLLTKGHLLIGDKTGAGVVVELIGKETKVIPSGKRYIAATNFSFTKPDAGNFPCPRFAAVRHALGEETADPDVSIAGFRKLLAEVAVPRTYIADEKRYGGTLYSNVYDLTHGNVVIYRESNWDRSMTINVDRWLTRGEATYSFDTLFARSPR